MHDQGHLDIINNKVIPSDDNKLFKEDKQKSLEEVVKKIKDKVK